MKKTLFFMLWAGSLAAQYSQETTAMYNFIKSKQESFPLPEESDTILICTYDAATKKFFGPGVPASPPADPGLGTFSIPIESEGNKTVVKFSVLNNYDVFFVTISGISYRSDPAIDHDNSIYIPVLKNPQLDRTWKMQVLNKNKSGKFRLQSLFVTAGVFTVPYIPINIIYEPYQNGAKTNHASYSISNLFSTTITMSFVTEKSTTKETAPPEFGNLKRFQEKALSVAGLLANFGPKAQAAGKVLQTIANALGSVQQSTTFGTIDEGGKDLTVSNVVTEDINTGINDGGPGVGDVFVFLKNARFAYLIENYRTTIVPLDYELVGQLSAKFLMSQDVDPKAGPMMELDPFVNPWGDRRLVLDKNRFETIGIRQIGGSTFEYTFAHQVAVADQKAATTYRTEVTDLRKGVLSFLGFGPSESKSTVLSVRNTVSKETLLKKTITAKFFLDEQRGQSTTVEVLYDRLFGTFVVRRKS